jgi:hypothetical protein
MFGDRNAKRFFGFAFLFALRRFAEEDLDEWRGRAAVLAEAITDLKSGSANQSMPQPPLVWAEAIPVRTGPLTSTGTPAVDNAIKMFESLPEFPRSQVWMRDRQAKLAAPAATDESGRPMIEARKRFALAHYNIRAAAFYQLVSTIELQNAFMTLLDYLEDMAWQDFIGERPLEVRNGAPSIAPGIVRRKRWWIRQGYKRLEALRRAQQVLKTGKRRGRRPDQKRRDAICNAISKHGDAWRDHLSEILKELDSKNDILLGDFQGREIDLGDGDRIKVAKWEDLDLAQGEQRRQIVDMLRKYAD